MYKSDYKQPVSEPSKQKRGWFPMSNHLIDELLPKLKDPSEFAVLAVIIRYTTGWHRTSARLSTRYLATACGLDKMTVHRALGRLQDEGLIEVVKVTRGGTFYRLAGQCMQGADGAYARRIQNKNNTTNTIMPSASSLGDSILPEERAITQGSQAEAEEGEHITAITVEQQYPPVAPEMEARAPEGMVVEAQSGTLLERAITALHAPPPPSAASASEAGGEPGGHTDREPAPYKEQLGAIKDLWAHLYGSGDMPDEATMGKLLWAFGGYKNGGSERLVRQMISHAGKGLEKEHLRKSLFDAAYRAKREAAQARPQPHYEERDLQGDVEFLNQLREARQREPVLLDI